MPLTGALISVMESFPDAEMRRNLSLEFSIQDVRRRMVELQWKDRLALEHELDPPRAAVTSMSRVNSEWNLSSMLSGEITILDTAV